MIVWINHIHGSFLEQNFIHKLNIEIEEIEFT